MCYYYQQATKVRLNSVIVLVQCDREVRHSKVIMVIPAMTEYHQWINFLLVVINSNPRKQIKNKVQSKINGQIKTCVRIVCTVLLG